MNEKQLEADIRRLETFNQELFITLQELYTEKVQYKFYSTEGSSGASEIFWNVERQIL
jgi:hypothetical protein